MSGNYKLGVFFPPWRQGSRKGRSHKEVMEVVAGVEPGFLASAHVEKRGDKRILRVDVDHPAGGITQHGVTLPDEETALFVERVIVQNREALKEDRATKRRQRDKVRAAVYHRLVAEQEREKRDRHVKSRSQ